MTKNFLLATAAVGVLALGGQATAHDLSFRATGAGINSTDTLQAADARPDDATNYNRSLVGLYLIAQEALGSTLGSGTLNLANPLTTGTLPSGNNLYVVELTNATFGAAFSTTNLSGANCSVVISSGGQATDSSVTFLVSTTGSIGCAGLTTVDVPVLPSAAGGTVSVSTNYTTEAGLPIDGGKKTLEAIYAIDAFQPAFNATLTSAGAGSDTTAVIGPVTPGGSTYTTLNGDTNLGKVAIYVDTRANENLADDEVDPTDVLSASVTINGAFSAFDGAAGAAGNPILDGVTADATATTVTANQAVFNNSDVDNAIVRLLSDKPSGAALTVTPDGGQIAASPYSGFIAYTLDTNYAAQSNSNVTLESIERDGTNFIAPWFGGSQASSTGVIRLSTTDAASGTVSVQLINGIARDTNGVSSNLADSQPCPVGIVPQNGDLVIDQTVMSGCFGAFVRGDVVVTVEAAPAGLTAKSRSSVGGNVYETTLGRYSGSQFVGADINEPAE